MKRHIDKGKSPRSITRAEAEKMMVARKAAIERGPVLTTRSALIAAGVVTPKRLRVR